MFHISPFIQLVVVAMMIAIVIMASEWLISGVMSVQQRLLDWARSTKNERSSSVALRVAHLSIAGRLFPAYRIKMKVRSLMYWLRPTARTRQRHIFQGSFGFSPGKHSPEVQRAITLKMMGLAMEVEAVSGEGGIEVAKWYFDEARQAAEYFGYAVLPDWTDYISQRQTLTELATA